MTSTLGCRGSAAVLASPVLGFGRGTWSSTARSAVLEPTRSGVPSLVPSDTVASNDDDWAWSRWVCAEGFRVEGVNIEDSASQN
jgi:hypothetical protein